MITLQKVSICYAQSVDLRNPGIVLRKPCLWYNPWIGHLYTVACTAASNNATKYEIHLPRDITFSSPSPVSAEIHGDQLLHQDYNWPCMYKLLNFMPISPRLISIE